MSTLVILGIVVFLIIAYVVWSFISEADNLDDYMDKFMNEDKNETRESE